MIPSDVMPASNVSDIPMRTEMLVEAIEQLLAKIEQCLVSH
jgi:hypothetical protein